MVEVVVPHLPKAEQLLMLGGAAIGREGCLGREHRGLKLELFKVFGIIGPRTWKEN